MDRSVCSKVQEKIVIVDIKGKERQYSIAHVLPAREMGDGQTYRILQSCFLQFASQQAPEVYLTEVLHPLDPRCDSPEAIEAKRKEMQGLFDKGAYEIVIAEDVPDGANILGGRFVLTIKNKKYRRDVLQGALCSTGP